MLIIVNSKNKWTLSPLGFDPDLSGPVGAGLSRSEDSDLSEPALGTESRLSRCIGAVSGFQPHRCRFIGILDQSGFGVSH